MSSALAHNYCRYINFHGIVSLAGNRIDLKSFTRHLYTISLSLKAIIAGDTMYISGQLGMDPKTMELVGSDVESQTKQALKNMGEILKCKLFRTMVQNSQMRGYLGSE